MKRFAAVFTPLATIFFTVVGLVLPKTSYALSLALPSCTISGKCDLCDLLELFVSVSQLFSAILGSVALIFFIYGAVWLLISQGNEQRITYGRKVIAGSLVGIVIVFSAFVIVNFVFWSLLGGEDTTLPSTFTQEWWSGPGCSYSEASSSCVGKSNYASCGQNQYCIDEECTDACDIVADITEGPYVGYSCKSITACAGYGDAGIGLEFQEYDECDLDVGCAKNLCPGGTDTVCCL